MHVHVPHIFTTTGSSYLLHFQEGHAMVTKFHYECGSQLNTTIIYMYQWHDRWLVYTAAEAITHLAAPPEWSGHLGISNFTRYIN